ncbi:hypothetical protein PRK78_004379 [Emydomyces testavorans]|uniref:Fork-head domain-containing protein n=1 Tax=Emydomyces testavorans TaxID=2070801 RepID=A0AAF0DK44_9EURO|nr:hypothetical protein PRK78_004379 [Emydomyces testavorans]
MSNSLPDQYAWEFDLSQVAGDSSLLTHHSQETTENIAYSPSRIRTPNFEPGDWFDINRLFPNLENVEHFAGLRDFQNSRESHDLNSPTSFRDSEALLAQYDLQDFTGSRPSFESSASRPGSAAYSSLTPNNSMAPSPLGDSQLFPQPRSVPDVGIGLSEEDSDTDSVTSDEPYARLIWKALMSTPGHKMVLKEIYEWFEKHTNKAKNPDSKGWQNSIRHNLSMNAAFEGVREPSSPGGVPKKSGNVWVLTERAVKHGVQSTTRYRKPGIHKKATKSEHPAPQRQRSGAKGGRAAKKAAKFRRALQEARRVGEQNCPSSHIQSESTNGIPSHTAYVEQEQSPSPANPDLNLLVGDYDLSGLSGCTNYPPESPVFYDVGTGEKRLISDYSILDGQAIGPDFNPFM